MFLRRLSLFSFLCPFLFQVCVPLFTMCLTMLTLVASVFTLTLGGTAVPERAHGSTVMSTPGRIIQRQKQARFISFKRTEEHTGRHAPLEEKNHDNPPREAGKHSHGLADLATRALFQLSSCLGFSLRLDSPRLYLRELTPYVLSFMLKRKQMLLTSKTNWRTFLIDNPALDIAFRNAGGFFVPVTREPQSSSDVLSGLLQSYICLYWGSFEDRSISFLV